MLDSCRRNDPVPTNEQNLYGATQRSPKFTKPDRSFTDITPHMAVQTLPDRSAILDRA